MSEPAPTPETLIDELTAYLDRADAMLAAGDYVALGGLDDAVRHLCQRTEAMRVDEAQHLLPALEGLRDRLDVLQQAMEEARQKVGEEIGNSDKRQKATRAYRPVEDKR